MALPLLFAAVPPLTLAADQIKWPWDLYNPNPRPDDVLLPLPCGGAMAFRWVRAEGAVPAGIAPGLAPLFRSVGPFEREGRHDLLVGKYEVSVAQYDTLPAMTGGPCPPTTAAGRQVWGGVGWYDALGFAAHWSRWLANSTGALPDCARAATLCIPRVAQQPALVRLPTEAEWEYLARGGLAVTPAQFGQPLYPMSDGLEHHAWYERNSDQKLKPIGQRAAGPLGLHDLYGNVEELTLDLYHNAAYPGQTGAAVIRGGSVYTGRSGIDAGQRRETPLYGRASHPPDNGVRLIADVTPALDVALVKAAPLPVPSATAVAGAGGPGQAQVGTQSRGPAPSTAPTGPPAVLTEAWPSQTAALVRPLLIVLVLVLGVPAFIAIRAALARRRPWTRLAPRYPFEPEMIALAGGEFWMGSPPDEPERNANEGPRHRVRIASFAIGKTAVTFAQYDAFCESTGRAMPSDQGWGRDRRPAINVSWEDAVAYAVWLSKETGTPYRLPSEAEWEYAARAGTETPFWTGRCITTDQANYDGNYDYNGCRAKTGVYRQQTVPVGSLPANPWGLHEVHGNVWEWVQDHDHDTYTGAPVDGSAWEASGRRVLRGGSWLSLPRNLRSADRNWLDTGDRNSYLGFRVARTLFP